MLLNVINNERLAQCETQSSAGSSAIFHDDSFRISVSHEIFMVENVSGASFV